MSAATGAARTGGDAGAGGRRAARKAANRAAILAAACEVFAAAGYGGASVRAIVRRTDLASGTFYNYVPDKAPIFRALVDDVADEARRRVRAARRRASTPEAFVADGYRAYFAFIVEDPGTFAFVARDAQTIREQFGDAVLPASTSELREDLEAAIAASSLSPVDVDYCAHAMTAVGLELGRRLVLRDPPDVEGATAFASALFLGGLSRAAALDTCPSRAEGSGRT